MLNLGGKTKNNLIFFFTFSLVITFFAVFAPTRAQAASLYFTPSSGVYQAGDLFTVNVYVNSAESTMNAASGVVAFPQDKLEVLSLNRGGSIFSLWVQEPTFSNSIGTINFEGVVLNPGFTGSGGKIISINLKAIKSGPASLTFASGSILANDGQGTNILSSTGSANFTVKETAAKTETKTDTKTETKAVEPSAKPTSPAETNTGLPPLPQITSTTHPDQNKWYNTNTVTFNWTMPTDVTAVNILADQAEESDPGTKSDGLFSTYSYQEVKDGIWYFHLRFKNSRGWGPIAHFRFQIDTQAPVPMDIRFDNQGNTYNPRPTVLFNTTDELSGMSYYEVVISNGPNADLQKVEDDMQSNPYSLPPQQPGKHTLVVKAFDKAGNMTTASKDFAIESINSPLITFYPTTVAENKEIVIKGLTYPKAQVVVWWRCDKNESPNTQVVSADDQGSFIFSLPEGLPIGNYRFWAEAVSENGAHSYPTEKYSVLVTQEKIIRLGRIALDFLSLIIPIIVMFAALIFLVVFLYHKICIFRKSVRQEIKFTEQNLRQAFNDLHTDLKKHVKSLEQTSKKRKLTREEEELVESFRNHLDSIEKLTNKSIDKLKSKLKCKTG